ncbi:MAG: PepSY domain-containing protein, partial [Acidobacteria bacterium]|nr:PepSY domain-containing protein [Acidobacteriota bacterium]
MTIRSLIFWPHLIAGVCAGLVILLMSVTGVALTYERQLIAWSDSDYRSTPPQEGASPMPVETLLARVQAAHPGQAPTAVTRSSDPTAPVQVGVGRQTLLVDAYSGAVLGESTTAVRQLMSDLRAWHRWIAMEGEGRATARAITGWSNLVFLFIVVTGAYLWIPRKWAWTHLRPVVLFGSSLRGKARDFNWHNVIGLWTVVPLFIVVLTALPISFPWANSAVYQLVGEAPPA